MTIIKSYGLPKGQFFSINNGDFEVLYTNNNTIYSLKIQSGKLNDKKIIGYGDQVFSFGTDNYLIRTGDSFRKTLKE